MCVSQGASLVYTRSQSRPSRSKPEELVVSHVSSTKVTICRQSDSHIFVWLFTSLHESVTKNTNLNVQFRCYLQSVLIPAPFRFYRACLQRTSLCSLLTGALLEATTALGARSSLPYPVPQGLNSHAVLKGGCFILA